MKLIELRGKYTSTNLSMEEKVQAKDRIEQRNKLLERDVQRLVIEFLKFLYPYTPIYDIWLLTYFIRTVLFMNFIYLFMAQGEI